MKDSTVVVTDTQRTIVLDNDEIAEILRQHFKLTKSAVVEFDVASSGYLNGAKITDSKRSKSGK